MKIVFLGAGGLAAGFVVYQLMRSKPKKRVSFGENQIFELEADDYQRDFHFEENDLEWDSSFDPIPSVDDSSDEEKPETDEEWEMAEFLYYEKHSDEKL